MPSVAAKPGFPLRLGLAARHVFSLGLKVSGVALAGLLVGVLVLRQPWPALVTSQPYLAQVSSQDLRLEQTVEARAEAFSPPAPMELKENQPTGLWHLRAIRAQEAWEVIEARRRTGSETPRVVVGVNEVFIDGGHPDLVGNTLPGVPDSGWVSGLAWLLNMGHGAGVLGLISGKGYPGMTGVAPHATLIPFSRLASEGDASVAASLRYFTDAGARVANFSMAASSPVADQSDIDQAYDRGLLPVAGLYNRDTDEPAYPAAYDKVLVVSGVDPEDRALGLGWGPFLDVVAPGPGVLTTAAGLRIGPVVFGQLYRPLCCNSVATAIVSGVAALLLEYDPTLSSAQLEKRIKLSARKVPGMVDERGNAALWHPRYGYGAVDAYGAVSYDRRGPEVSLRSVERGADGRYRISGEVRDDVDDTGLDPGRTRDSHLWGIPTSNVARVEYRVDGGAWSDAPLSPEVRYPVTLADYTRTYAVVLDADTSAAAYQLQVRAWDTAGNVGEEVSRQFHVAELR